VFISNFLKIILMSGLLGKKIGMSQIFEDNGNVVPVTYVLIDVNTVYQLKTLEKDGVNAVVLGLDPLKKPLKTRKFKYLKEFALGNNLTGYKPGEKITIEALKEVDQVMVVGISKGKGFQGVIKRYNFHGGPKTHGSTFHRSPGSVGCRAKPGRIHKGKKLPGQMGGDTVTLAKRKIVSLNIEKKLLAIKGSLPGANNSLIIIKF
jgi:large subunit ribosomal protein L3